MRFEYTDHAEENLAERKIDKKLVEESIKNPDEIITGKFGRKIAHKLVGDKLLRVIYEEQDNVYIVVTAYYTKPGRY